MSDLDLVLQWYRIRRFDAPLPPAAFVLELKAEMSRRQIRGAEWP